MHVLGPRAARSLLPELSRNGAKLLAVHWHWPRVLESLRPFSGHCDGGLPLTLKSKQTLNPQSSWPCRTSSPADRTCFPSTE